MSTYYFPSLHKGLVDGSAKGKLDDDYKHQCGELKNGYIKPNRNIATRPGLKRKNLGKDIIDISARNGSTYVLRNPESSNLIDRLGVTSTNPMHQFLTQLGLQDNFFQTFINWSSVENVHTFRTQSGGLISGDFNSRIIDVYNDEGDRIDDSCYLVLHATITSDIKFIHSAYNDLVDNANDASIFYAATASTDLAITARDRVYNITGTFHPWSDNRILNYSQSLLLFQDLDPDLKPFSEYTPGTVYAADDTSIVLTPDIAADNSPFAQQTNYCNDAGELEYVFIFRNPYAGFDPVYQGIVNLPKIDQSIDLRENNIRDSLVKTLTSQSLAVPALGGSISNSPDLSIKVHLSNFYNNRHNEPFVPHLSNDTSLPNSFEQRENGAGLTLFGYNYTIEKQLVCDHTNTSALDAYSLSEENMQTFSEKVIDRSLENLPIAVASYQVYSDDTSIDVGTVSQIGTTGFYSSDNKIDIDAEVVGFNDFLINNPEYSVLKDYLKLALLVTKQEKGDIYYPRANTLLGICPDLKITLPGTDVTAEGTYLFTLPNGDHVFVGASSNVYYDTFRDATNQTAFDADNPVSRVDNPFIQEADGFGNGTGGTLGSLGVTLYIQRGNDIATNGVPVYCPIPGSDTGNIAGLDARADGNLVGTTAFLHLSIDYSNTDLEDFMNELKYLSFYGSAGESRANINSLIQTASINIDPDYLDKFKNLFKYNGLVLAANVTGDTVNANAARNFFIDMQISDIDLTPIAAQYISNKDISFNDSVAPLRYEKPTPGYDNTMDSVKSWIPRFETKPYLRYLGNPQVNNYLYPRSLNDTDAITQDTIDSYNKVLTDLENKRLANTRSYVGKLVSYVWRDGSTRYPDAPAFFDTGLRAGTPETDRNYNSLDFSNLAFITEIKYTIPIAFTGNRRTVQQSASTPPPYTTPPSDLYETNNIIEITYQRLHFYIADTITYADEDGNAQTVDARQVDSLIVDYQRRIEELTVSRDQRLIDTYYKPYSTNFTVYNEPNNVSIRVNRRFLQSHDGRLHFSSSEPDGEDIFSRGIVDFIEENYSAISSPEYLRNSGLRVANFQDIIRQNPQSFELIPKYNREPRPVAEVDISGDTVILTNQAAYNEDLTKTLFDSGFSTDVFVESSMLIGALGSEVKVARYFEESRGFVDYVANNKLAFPGDVTSVAGLLEKYKLLFFTVDNESEKVYTLSIGKDRKINGFSRFDLPVGIRKCIQIDEDRMGFISVDGNYYEMDFSSRDVQDQTAEDGTIAFYDWEVRTMPLLNLTERNFSPNTITNINKLVIGMDGNAAFIVKVINSLKGTNLVSKEFRRNDPADMTQSIDYEGQALVEGIPPNGCELPEIAIEKSDGRYLEISSVTVIGDY